jgi:hypothetical protein
LDSNAGKYAHACLSNLPWWDNLKKITESVQPLYAQGGGHEQPISPFTADQFIHCTQDEDHGVSTSPRISVSETNAPVDSPSSSSQWTDDLPISDSYTYQISDIHSQQPTRWVYEWVDPKLYNMCYHD